MKHTTLDGVRLHLIDDKLVVNGRYHLYLNETAKEIVETLIDESKHFSKGEIPSAIVTSIRKKYNVDKSRVLEDFNSIICIVNAFARNEVPENLVNFRKAEDITLTAPNRMDLSLTYRCNNTCSHCYLPDNSSEKEISFSEWQCILTDLWNIGIPEVVFTGGEVTLRKDVLVDLLIDAGQFVTGIISNGTRIDKLLAYQLKKANLDWIQITLESPNEKVHDKMVGRKGAFKGTVAGIKNCVKAGLSVNLNATITKQNQNDINDLISFGKKLGVECVSTNAIIRAGKGVKAHTKDGLSEEVLMKILKEAKVHAEKENIAFNWYLPTCYNNLNPIELGFGVRSCSACTVNMMIEPDGSVIPCQSWTKDKLGNILTDSWDSIWNHEIAVKARNHDYKKSECMECEYVELCKGGCPL